MVNNAARSLPTYDQAAFTTSPARETSRFPNFHRHYDAEPDRKWQVEVSQRICEFASRDAGWDGDAALPVKWDAGMFVMNILNSVMQNRTPTPQLVPTPVGGIQIEWHEKGVDLEIHVTAPYQFELWFEDHRTGEVVSKELTSDLSPVRVAVQTMTAR